MPQAKPGLQLITLIVPSYDQAIAFFVHGLDFTLIEDSPSTTSASNKPKRWVVIRPPDSPEDSGNGCNILLAQADGPGQRAIIGKQFAGRVGLFWHVRDFDASMQRLRNLDGVEIHREPVDQPYGRVAVWRDLWGNLWDLIGPVSSKTERE